MRLAIASAAHASYTTGYALGGNKFFVEELKPLQRARSGTQITSFSRLPRNPRTQPNLRDYYAATVWACLSSTFCTMRLPRGQKLRAVDAPLTNLVLTRLW